MTSPRKSRDPKTLRPATQLVHGGTLRSGFEETSEALFLTQGYLYDTMEIAEARFKGDDAGLRLFALLQPDGRDVRAADGAARGGRGGAGDGERDGRGHRFADGPAQGGRPHRRRAGAVRLVSLCGRGVAAALRRRLDPRRRRGPRRVAGGGAPEHQDGVPRIADQPDARDRRHRRRRRRSCTAPARRWWSTTCSPRPCCSIR